MIDSIFPPGTPVRVQQTIHRMGKPLLVECVGVVEAWEALPTGSWYAHGRNDRLWLNRLRLRKADGERTLLVVDDATSIARIEPTGTT
ncbi:MAG: hypothetical protein HY763_03265 [Planctomycetes bacterium]|nr:hypothetical protein [Planctomycetota bacterium]